MGSGRANLTVIFFRLYLRAQIRRDDAIRRVNRQRSEAPGHTADERFGEPISRTQRMQMRYENDAIHRHEEPAEHKLRNIPGKSRNRFAEPIGHDRGVARAEDKERQQDLLRLAFQNAGRGNATRRSQAAKMKQASEMKLQRATREIAVQRSLATCTATNAILNEPRVRL